MELLILQLQLIGLTLMYRKIDFSHSVIHVTAKMKQKNMKSKFINELIVHWQNGASQANISDMILDFSDSITPNIKDYGYSKAFRSEDFDTLLRRLSYNTYLEISKEFEDIIVSTLKRKFERRLETGRMTMYAIYRDIRKYGLFAEAKERLYDLADVWQEIIDMKEIAKEKTGLAYFVNDKQNVHTTVITTQTNTMMDDLAKQPVKKKQRTLDEILTCWQIYTWAEIEPVYKDMKYWGDMSDVIVPNDFAYRVALRALWAKIKTYDPEIRDELIKRLFEECRDSVEMCAQGHLTRLANVLVGFDATAAPQKESLQEKMAAISILDLGTELKIAEATKIMDDMNMSLEERVAWLEAF